MSDPNVIEQPEARPVVACSDLLGAQNYQPEMWTVAKDVIYAAIPALEFGMEYTQELLAHQARRPEGNE